MPDFEHRFESGARALFSTLGERPPRGGEGVASVQLWIGAGTAAETARQHGCAHLLEHMVFKPRPGDGATPTTDLATGIESLGGDVNAYTSYDETVYHVTVPLRAVESATRILLDTVLDPVLDAEELAREREVVVEEILQYDDDPASASMDRMVSELFEGHDYGRPILGTVETVRGHDARRLRAFHRGNYAGARVSLVVAGAVDPRRIVALARPRLDALPRRRPLARPGPTPSRSAALVRVLAGDVHEVHLRLAWVAPGVREADAVALDLAATALGHGESSPLSARVRRELQLVSDAHASYLPFARAGIFLLSGQTVVARAEAAIRQLVAELSRLARVPLERDAFARAQAQLRSSLVYRRETVQGRAHALGFFATVAGSVEAERAYEAALESLDADMVQAAVARCVEGGPPVVHLLLPEQAPEAGSQHRRALGRRLETLLRPPTRARRPVLEVDDRGVHHGVLPGGLALRVLPDARVPVVGGLLVWRGGLRAEPKRLAGATHLASALLTRGTRGRDGERLARDVDDMAGLLEGFAGRNSVGLQFESLAPYASTLVRRAIECACAPAFAEAELDEERRVTIEELAADADDLGHCVFREMLGVLYGRHPYGRSVRGTPASLARIGSGTLRGLWTRHYGLERAALCVAGSVDPLRLYDQVAAAVDDFAHGAVARPSVPTWPGEPPRPGSRARLRTLRRARAQAHVAIGFPGLPIGHPDQATLEVLVTVLGGQSGRLFTELRERDGLVYHAGASASEGLDAGHVSIYAATSQDKLPRTMDAIWGQVRSLAREAPGEAEFERARAWLVGNHMQGLQRRSRIAAHLAFAAAYELPPQYYFELPRRLAAVTRCGVQALAQALLRRDRSVTALIRAPSS